MEDATYGDMNKILSIVPAQGVATCDRCFKQISWVATVQTETGIVRVGVDCAETMQAQNVAIAKKNIATAKKVQGWAKGAKSIRVVQNAYLKSVGKPMDTVEIETAKGLLRRVKISFLTKYGIGIDYHEIAQHMVEDYPAILKSKE